ncbi:MAG: BREX-6 system BrxE protein [Myxococcota bacterium]|nr:BREX-6 system BrxE protein [Myxococcota bacterium]
MTVAAPETLDKVLGIQLLIAWAGESAGGDHPRLGWWKTDLIDEEGGGDLWKRLLPRTAAWAGLDAARRAARLTDERVRRDHARADQMWTLFHLGFELDEALDERLALHKLEAHPPAQTLPVLAHAQGALSAATLRAALATPALDAAFKVIPNGRQLKRTASDSPDQLALRLAAALLEDPPPAYPLPFVLTEADDARR